MKRLLSMVRTRPRLLVVTTAVGLLLCGYILFGRFAERAVVSYNTLASEVLYDRTGRVVRISLNGAEQVCLFASAYPDSVTELVLAKEDQWFYFHPGFNPYRTMSAALSRVQGVPSGGASTITQQLAKTLLYTTNERSFSNKIRELVLALALELRLSKDEILTMYLNTVPLGGNLQGFPAAARAYFDKQLAELNENETLQLVSAFSDPNNARPLSETNLARATVLSSMLGTAAPLDIRDPGDQIGTAWLELGDVLGGCSGCTATLDVELTERIRELLRRHVARTAKSGATHGAVAVVAVETGELLALVGSPAPESDAGGMRINMALETRPIGSTVKPFLYLFGFMQGLRPYTIAHDQEYKYGIETGFPLYPKNYDGKYRGDVTLEESLGNSLNVPTVEVLRYTTLDRTYEYFEHTLHFAPRQPWDAYAYGIALGGLELDLLTLTHAFTALANRGEIARLRVAYTALGDPFFYQTPHSTLDAAGQIAPREHVALVNSILTDRTIGVEQFGQSGSLYLSRPGYGVKTGTSRDYHDSWTVGYTGDYAVGVWIGNAENKPMHAVTGAMGAGTLWRDVMELMYTTPYYKGTELDLGPVVAVPTDRGHSYGLPGDDVEHARGLLAVASLIQLPHDGDTFLYTQGMRIPLTAAEDAQWFINEVRLKDNVAWYPKKSGRYTLTARTASREETIQIQIVDDPVTVP